MSQAYTTIDEWKECSAAFEQFHDVVEPLRSEASQQLDHGEMERFLETEGRDLLRHLLPGDLDARAANETVWESLEGRDGIMRTHHRHEGTTPLATLFGEVVVTRHASSAPGTASLCPMDATLNLPPDTYSDGLRRRLAHDVALMSFDAATAHLAQTTGGRLPTRQREDVAVQVAHDVEAFSATRQAQETAASDDLLVLTTDRKGMVMRHEDLREATRTIAERAHRKRKPRLRPGEKRQRKRMATVASVSTVAPSVRSPESVRRHQEERVPRPPIEKKRVSASGEREAGAVIDDLFPEACRRAPTQQRPWVIVNV